MRRMYMKIKLFNVRNDEKAAVDYYSKQLGVETEITEEELEAEELRKLKGFDGISVLTHKNVNKELLDALKEANINCISTRTVGFNHIDLNYAKKLGIRVCNAKYPPNGVAEFTVMLMLIALRKYKPAMWRQGVNDYSLSGLQGKELGQCTVGIIGTGRIGQAVLKNLTGFGCKLIAYDPYPQESVQKIADYVDIDTLFKTSDIVSLHVPFTEDNRYMINADNIAKMKKGVLIVNASRGELVDIDALIEAIESEHVGAVAMDVIEDEVGIYHQRRINDIIKNRKMAYLRQFPNVVLTQHMAFYTNVNVDSMVECSIQGIKEIIETGHSIHEIKL